MVPPDLLETSTSVRSRSRPARIERTRTGDTESSTLKSSRVAVDFVVFGDGHGSLSGAALTNKQNGFEAFGDDAFCENLDFFIRIGRLARKRCPAGVVLCAFGGSFVEIVEACILGVKAAGDFVANQNFCRGVELLGVVDEHGSSFSQLLCECGEQSGTGVAESSPSRSRRAENARLSHIFVVGSIVPKSGLNWKLSPVQCGGDVMEGRMRLQKNGGRRMFSLPPLRVINKCAEAVRLRACRECGACRSPFPGKPLDRGSRWLLRRGR